MASNLTKRKRDEPEPGHKPDEDLCWSGHQCVPSPPLSLSSHSIYLSSADIDAVLIIATNYPWRCTPLVSHRWCRTVGVAPLVSHRWCRTVGVAPLVSLRWCRTVGVAPLVSHRWCRTVGVAPLVSHRWCRTVGVAPLVSH